MRPPNPLRESQTLMWAWPTDPRTPPSSRVSALVPPDPAAPTAAPSQTPLVEPVVCSRAPRSQRTAARSSSPPRWPDPLAQLHELVFVTAPLSQVLHRMPGPVYRHPTGDEVCKDRE